MMNRYAMAAQAARLLAQVAADLADEPLGVQATDCALSALNLAQAIKVSQGADALASEDTTCRRISQNSGAAQPGSAPDAAPTFSAA
jgi:hypothetical protein